MSEAIYQQTLTGQQELVRKPAVKRKERDLLGQFVMLGAGVQSSTIAEMIVEGELPKPLAVIFADTGDEPAYVYAHVAYLQKRLAGLGVPLQVVTAPRGSSGVLGTHNAGRRLTSLESGLKPLKVRNKRDVWHINTQAFKDAHFATFPPKLVQNCLLAGTPVQGIVIDMFGGSGTVGCVAAANNRRYVLNDLNAEYVEMAQSRLAPFHQFGAQTTLFD